MAGRSGPACLARAPAARANSLAGFLPGTSPAAVIGSIGVPGARSRLVWRYCVTGGGQLAVVFPRHGGASMIATTARGYRLDGIGPGSSLASLQRRYGRAGLRAVGSRLLVTPGGQVFIVRSGRVTAVALVARSVLAKPGALQAAAGWPGLDDLDSAAHARRSSLLNLYRPSKMSATLLLMTRAGAPYWSLIRGAAPTRAARTATLSVVHECGREGPRSRLGRTAAPI